jgi:hypothetical protein
MKTIAPLLVVSLLLCACGAAAPREGARNDVTAAPQPTSVQPTTATRPATPIAARATSVPASVAPASVAPATEGPATVAPTTVVAATAATTARPVPTPLATAATEGRAPELFKPLTVTDPSAENTDAFSLLVPDGWQASGSVQWMHEWERLVNILATVTDPSTGLTIDWLPIQDFMYFDPQGFNVPIGGNYQGKAYVPPITDPTRFVTSFWAPNALANLQGASPVSVTQVPEIAAEFKRGFGGPADAFAYRLRYEYQQGGQPWEEDVSFALLFAQANGITSWYVNFAYAVRAPKGQLDANAGVISTVVASLASTPHWEAIVRLVQQLFIQGIRQQMADTEAFGRALAQYRAETQALQDQVTQERQASEDRIAELRGETLLGIQSYDNPVTGAPVQLPSGWNSYWVNGQGQYATAEPGFDPNAFNGGGWQQLLPHAF